MVKKQNAAREREPRTERDTLSLLRRALRFFLVGLSFFYRDATYKLITERAHNLLLGTLSALLLLFFL